MEVPKDEPTVVVEVIDKIAALKALQEIYSDMLNEYERQIDELAGLSRVPRSNLYNPATLHEIESTAHRKNYEDLLSAVWITRSQLEDIIAVQRTICILKRLMSEDAVVASGKKGREIVKGDDLPYETNG
ncbi:MAG: hypothetical protein MIO87_00550 [Methanomassiliicoccales archaeon]|nr:hypothetical protein [Methanomassiliicoccales archaeon]TFG56244.1 MAG: hypothetical protein E4H30_04810 [Methanomassiliicoccus sp.]